MCNNMCVCVSYNICNYVYDICVNVACVCECACVCVEGGEHISTVKTTIVVPT